MQVKCTSCGASQELTENKKCGYCGVSIEIEKAVENYKLANTGEIGNLMMMAETAIEASNLEEALQYYNKVLEKDITNSDAWLGKGIAIVYTSKIGNIKTTEAIVYWKNAIKNTENIDAMGKRVAKEINKVVNSFYPAIENHYIQFNELDNSYQELVTRFKTLENALNFATQLDKTEIKYPETGYELCKRVINLPKTYALENKSDAQLIGTLGQFTTNKYAAAQARRDSMDKVRVANRRLEEITGASMIVDSIQKKYVTLIQEIDPNHKAVLEKIKLIELNKQIRKQINHESKNGGYYFWGAIIGFCVGEIIAIPLSRIFPGIPVILIIICGIIFGILGLFFADKLVKKKNTELYKIKKENG